MNVKFWIATAIFFLLIRFVQSFKKGAWYYESQILMFVLQWQHDMKYKPVKDRGLWIGRLHIWRDTAWLVHGFGWKLNRIWDFIHQTYLRWREYILRKVALKLGDLVLIWASWTAFYRLSRAGFHITYTKGEMLEIYRFWWKDKVIRDMADIDYTGDGHWNTIHNGRSQRLG